MVVCRFLLLGYFIYFSTSILLVQGAIDFGALILTPYIKNDNAFLARSLAKVDPDKFLGLESYSAFITVKEEYDSNIFFWYFPHSSLKDVPWVIWLQGGPGVSSLMGALEGVGPFKIEDGVLKPKNVTWASDYSLLFIDNPVGAGFSYTGDERGYTTSEEDVGAQLLEFLSQFLCVFPELRRAPLFLAGESYAGKYLPAFGSYIHRHMNTDSINFRGISIGNGLIDPRSQMLKGHRQLCDVLGLLGDDELASLEKIQQDSLIYLDQGRMIDAANKFNESIEFIKKKSGVNIYNFDRNPSPSSVNSVETFVTREDIRQCLHVGNATYTFNNQSVYQAMLPDFMNSTKSFVEELLEHYGFMSYSGQLDIIVPYSLSKSLYAQLKWSKRDEYDAAPRKRIRNAGDGNVVAYSKSGGNFIELVVRHTGHMVPDERPNECKFLIDTFIDQFK